MTSPASARPASKTSRAAFSLIEVLVVLGILVLIAGILYPMIQRANRQANRTAIAAELQTVATALEAYHADFGDYPRPDPADTASVTDLVGAEVLGKALLGPGPALPVAYSASTDYEPGDFVTDGGNHFVAIAESNGEATSDTNFWIPQELDYVDGANGPGFRVRSGGAGRVYGPYIAADKIDAAGMQLLDNNGSAILYFPASLKRPNVGTSYVNVPASNPLYNAHENYNAFARTSGTGTPLERMQVMLGDYNASGNIDAGESPKTIGPYLLWSAGDDGVFGPDTVQASDASANREAVAGVDDVTNFNQ